MGRNVRGRNVRYFYAERGAFHVERERNVRGRKVRGEMEQEKSTRESLWHKKKAHFVM